MEYRSFEDREGYIARQVAASTSKISYCKVSWRDVETYLAIIRHDRAERADATPIGPILSLGVRGGREVDLFRIALDGSWPRRCAVKWLERRWHGVNSLAPPIERFGRSDWRRIEARSSVGVELNPGVQRPDVWVGSYDALPSEWDGRFGVVFSNAFDHAFEPKTTAAAWRRAIRACGYLVLEYPEAQASAPLDPVGRLMLDDVRRLFPGELVYFRHRGSVSRYTESIIRMP